MTVSSDPPAAPVEGAPATESHTADGADRQPQTAASPVSAEVTKEQRPEDGQTAAAASCSLPVHDDAHGENPLDFQGAVESDNELPSAATLRKIADYVVLDRDGKSRPFKSLYTGPHVARRVLVIFVRHFFCGNCQEYLRTLSAAITPDALLRLPVSTFVAVVGCGDPGLIDMYVEATGCPFPVYADPTRRLYSELGMVKSLALGERPAYMRKGLLKSSIESIFQGLRQIPKGLSLKGGDQRQIGGEFLFEPVDLFTPVSSPWGEEGGEEKRLGNGETDGGVRKEEEGDGGAEPKRVTWCHRMRTTRDHAEIPELMEVLGLDPADAGKPPRAEDNGGAGTAGEAENKRWSKAMETRKGTGMSMASQLSAKKAAVAAAAASPEEQS